MAKSNEKIRIGVDSNIIIYLAKYVNPIFDPSGNIHKLLENEALFPEAYDGMRIENLPPLLQDTFLGKVHKLPNGLKIYGNLRDIKTIYNMVVEGKLELCVSPTVYFEIEQDYSCREFVANYTTRLKVNDEDTVEFFGKRWELAEKYSKYIPKDRDAVTLKERVSADACEMAEYSLFGLNVITANEKHLIHKFFKKKDFIISEGIKEVNKEQGLMFFTRDKKLYAPCALTLEQLIAKIKKSQKMSTTPRVDFVNVNIDEDNAYILR